MPAAAQTTLDAEELRRRTQREAEERQHRQSVPDSRLQLEGSVSDTLELPTEAPCFEIRTLRLEGERLDYFPWAQSYLDRYAGRCIGAQGVNLVVRRLGSQFIHRGFITTRVGVPEQDLSAGTLRVRLIPGVIRELRFSDPELRGTWKSAFPSRSGDLLNLRDLEQGLEQMKRVPYQDVNLDIAPGGEAGESDVIIAVAREKPWKLIFSLDDSGSKATGELQASATLALNNPLGINDLFYVTVNNDVEGAGAQLGSRGDSFSYSLPWGYWTFGVSGSRFRFHQTIQGQSQRFSSEGESDQAELKIQRVIQRDQVSKSGVQLRLVKRHNKSFIDDTEIDVQRRNLTDAEIAFVQRRYVGPFQLDFTLAHREGVPWLDAQDDPENRTRDQPTTRYRLETAELSVIAPFTVGEIPMRYIGVVRGQTTQTPLFVSEFFSIGNRYTVRGFDGEQTLAAERGWFIRNEVEAPLRELTWGRWGNTLYAGVDHGQVDGRSAELLPGRRLTGMVLGLRGGGYGFFYDAFAGWPIDKPARFETDEPTFGFQLAYQF